jgi:hypothetical protein
LGLGIVVSEEGGACRVEKGIKNRVLSGCSVKSKNGGHRFEVRLVSSKGLTLSRVDGSVPEWMLRRAWRVISYNGLGRPGRTNVSGGILTFGSVHAGGKMLEWGLPILILYRQRSKGGRRERHPIFVSSIGFHGSTSGLF